MMIAQTSEGKRVLANQGELSKNEVFYCPGCHEEVILKKGRIKVPYFSHQANSVCMSLSEGESVEHLLGKHQLASWIQKNVEVEAYLPKLQQRPDLLWGNIAIELQCSRLSFDRFEERTQNYLKHGYLPWWILGGQLSPQKQWSALAKACCYDQKTLGPHLWTIQTGKNELRLFYDLSWHYQMGYTFQEKSWVQQSIPISQVWDFRGERRKIVWSSKAYRINLQKRLSQYDKSLLLLQERFYLIGQNILYLPEWCYEKSPYFFYYKDNLTFFRYCFLVTENYQEWRYQIRMLTKNWGFPLISQERILQEIYQECEKIKKIY